MDKATFYYLCLGYGIISLAFIFVYLWRGHRWRKEGGELCCKFSPSIGRKCTALFFVLICVFFLVPAFPEAAHLDVNRFFLALLCLIHAAALALPTYVYTKGFLIYVNGFTSWEDIERLWVTEQRDVYAYRKDQPSVYLLRKIHLGKCKTSVELNQLPVCISDGQPPV